MEKHYYHALYPYTIISSDNKDNAYRMKNFHTHFTLEIFYVTSGTTKVDYFAKDNVLQTAYLLPGQFIVIFPETKHKFNIDEEAYFMVLELGFSPAQSPTVDKWLASREAVQNCPSLVRLLQAGNVLLFNDTQNVRDVLFRLLKMISDPQADEFFSLQYEVLLKSLLLEIGRCKATDGISRGNRHIMMCERFIRENYMRPITLDDIAEHVHISKIYLESLFKKSQNRTVGNLLTECRIKKSLELLADRNLTIQSIAKKVGYRNVRTFQIAFARQMKISPLEYRNTVSQRAFHQYTENTARILSDSALL